MNDDKDVNPAETPSPSVDVSTASSAETPQPETPAPDKGSKTSNREALIAKLTANKEQTPDKDEPVTEPAKAEEVTEQPEVVKDETTEAPAAITDDGEPPEAELQHYSENAQNRIRQAIKARKDVEAKLKESEGLAGFGADILDRAQKAGVPPQVFVDWVDTGAEIYTDPQNGAQRLVKMAESLGYKPASAGVPEGFDKLLAKLEEDLEISPDAAKAIRARLKPAEPQALPVAPQQPAAQQRPAINADRAQMDRAVFEMNKMSAEYAKAHGTNWKEIEAEAAKGLEKYKGSPTSLWPGLFRDAVELAVAKRKASAPPLKQITKTLRPTTAPPGKETPKSNRERVLQKYT